MCPSTPSPGNTVDTIFLKHWSVQGHPWLWDSTLTILALKLASLLSGRRWQVRHDTIMTTLYLCSMFRQNVFIPSLNSYQHHTFKCYCLTQLSRQLLQWGVQGSLKLSCLNNLKLTTVIIYTLIGMATSSEQWWTENHVTIWSFQPWVSPLWSLRVRLPGDQLRLLLLEILRQLHPGPLHQLRAISHRPVPHRHPHHIIGLPGQVGGGQWYVGIIHGNN